jgi:hypothetical protein
MGGPVTEDMVALLGRAAGFELAPERCRILAAQLEWLLSEAGHLSKMDLKGEEPIFIYQTWAFSSINPDDPRQTSDDQKTQGEL